MGVENIVGDISSIGDNMILLWIVVVISVIVFIMGIFVILS